MKQIRNIGELLSWWEYEHFIDNIDYTIIGAGIVGLSTAIELKKAAPTSKILVVDKKKVPIGASTKNAGFACFGSISEIYDDFNAYGEKVCKKLIQMRWEGLSIMKSRISKTKMDYHPISGAEIFESRRESEFYSGKLSWANALVSDMVEDKHCFFEQNGRFGIEINNKYEGSLNPQKMMNELELIARSLGVSFIYGIDVDQIDYEKRILKSSQWEMFYNKLIICTNGFSKVLLRQKDIKPARNQVFITNRIPGFKLNHCYHMNKGYVYFRSYRERLLIGGGRDLDKEGETTAKLGTTELITTYLKKIVQEKILPNQPFKVEHSWSGILGVGETKMPMVEKLDDNVLVAVRMGGMGVAIGSFIGRVASSMMLSIDNRAHQLYVS